MEEKIKELEKRIKELEDNYQWLYSYLKQLCENNKDVLTLP